MIIIYYRDESGAIVSHHGPAEGQTLEKLQELVLEYNKKSEERKTRNRTAFVEEVADDSLTAYLFKKAAERRKLDKEAVQDAISSIEAALDSVRDLEGWT